MNSSPNDSSRPSDDDCLSSAIRAAASMPGITFTGVDPHRQEVKFAWDVNRVTEQDATRLLETLRPEMTRRFERCILRLDGHACESCALRLERRVEKIPGIRHATASFIGGTMSINYDPQTLPSTQVVEKVLETGALVRPMETEAHVPKTGLATSLEGEKGQILSLVAGLIAMLSAWAGERFGLSTLLCHALYAGAYVLLGWPGVRAGFQSLRNGTVDIDLLMILAALGAAYIGAPLEGAMLLFLFSLSDALQDMAMDRTRKAIHALMRLRPETALVKRGDQLLTLPIEALVVGDHVVVRPGENIPLDGTIVEGNSELNEASLTGESMPVSKGRGDPVFAGTTNQSGGIEIEVARLAKDSAIARLVRMVEEAQSEKARTQRFLEKAEQGYALGVILLTLALILIPWLLLGGEFKAVFYRAMTLMVVASPCALVISTPATILSAIGGAARRGVLFKGGAHLERAASVTVVAMDKTGTLTEGRPRVTDILPLDAEKAGARVLLERVASVEAKSEHPLARAIVGEAESRGIEIMPCSTFQSVAGKGASGLVGGRRLHVGSEKYFNGMNPAGMDKARELASPLQEQGRTVIFAAEEDPATFSFHMLGVFALADVLRPGAAAALRELREVGVRRIVMLTGDHARVAEAIGREAGVDEVHAGLLPEDKVRLIRQLKATGSVLMVGDGVNDAPALAASNLGAAMGAAGTDAAMETADVVLMGENLSRLAYALDVSRQARKVVIQNLTFALGVILLLAIAALGFDLSLPAGVIGHEGSTVLVCLNGLRLLRYNGRHGIHLPQ